MAKRADPFQALAEARGARIEKGVFELAHDGRTWQVLQEPKPPRLKVRLRGRGLPPQILRRETRWDVLGKRLRVNRELDTGDRAFDEAVYLETDAADHVVREVLGVAGFMPAARELILAGWTLAFDRDGMAARLPIPAGAEALRERFEAALDPLAALAEACERFPVGPYPMRPGRHVPTLVVLASSFSFAAGMVAMVWTEWNARPLNPAHEAWAALGGLPLWLAAVGAVHLLVRGRSTSLRALALSAALLRFGAPVLAMTGALAANALFDGAPPVEHLTRVVDSRVVRGKHRTHYVTLASWRDGGDALEVKIKERDFGRFSRTGTKVVIRTGDGALGWPWLAGLGVADGLPERVGEP